MPWFAALSSPFYYYSMLPHPEGTNAEKPSTSVLTSSVHAVSCSRAVDPTAPGPTGAANGFKDTALSMLSHGRRSCRCRRRISLHSVPFLSINAPFIATNSQELTGGVGVSAALRIGSGEGRTIVAGTVFKYRMLSGHRANLSLHTFPEAVRLCAHTDNDFDTYLQYGASLNMDHFARVAPMSPVTASASLLQRHPGCPINLYYSLIYVDQSRRVQTHVKQKGIRLARKPEDVDPTGLRLERRDFIDMGPRGRSQATGRLLEIKFVTVVLYMSIFPSQQRTFPSNCERIATSAPLSEDLPGCFADDSPFKKLAVAVHEEERHILQRRAGKWSGYDPIDILDNTPAVCGPGTNPLGKLPRRAPANKLSLQIADGIAMYATAYHLLDKAFVYEQSLSGHTISGPVLGHEGKDCWVKGAQQSPVYDDISDVQQLVDNVVNGSALLKRTMQVLEGPAPNPAANVDNSVTLRVANEVLALGKAKKTLNIVRNIAVVALCINIMCNGKVHMPEAPDPRLGEDEVPGLREALESIYAAISPRRFRQTLQIAVSLTPLALLVPKDLSKYTVCPEETYLNSKRAGNQFPSCIQALQADVMGAIFLVSQGQKAALDAFHDLAHLWREQKVSNHLTEKTRETYTEFLSVFHSYLQKPLLPTWPRSSELRRYIPVELGVTTRGRAFTGQGSSQDKDPVTPGACNNSLQTLTQPTAPAQSASHAACDTGLNDDGETLDDGGGGKGTGSTSAESSEADSERNPEHHRRESTERPESSDCSGADSLASIDTISDTGSAKGSISDTERERNWRVRKILKYSRWKNQVDASTRRGAKRAKDIERRVAKQEQKLRDLEAGVQANRTGLETVEEGLVRAMCLIDPNSSRLPSPRRTAG
ncbi:hypothetical protein NMY22_g16258 [Coprinellus aureogranulatus]|nr:hypothetical protein NMY22_g16258 [Coprinellus aureogranulatus]